MKDENQHLKITSVQCTYYKPGHLRPIFNAETTLF